MMHFNSCKLPVEMCSKCRQYLLTRYEREPQPMTACNVPNCTGSVHARGMCGKHYQRWRSGRDPFAAAPRDVHSPGWTPPEGLSAQWQDSVRPQAPRALQGRSCALEACAGTAVAGSPYCAPHKGYREAQDRLKAKVQR